MEKVHVTRVRLTEGRIHVETGMVIKIPKIPRHTHTYVALIPWHKPACLGSGLMNAGIWELALLCCQIKHRSHLHLSKGHVVAADVQQPHRLSDQPAETQLHSDTTHTYNTLQLMQFILTHTHLTEQISY